MPIQEARALRACARPDTGRDRPAAPPLRGIRRAARTLAAVVVLGAFGLGAARGAPADDSIALPAEINDPFEPVNRLMWGANKGFTNGVLWPLSKVYKAIVGEKARESVNHFARNIEYPEHVINHSLQGENQRARDETRRFLTNTTQGVLGLYDPATKRKDIPKIEADFGQTLGKWGWREPKTFLMLPGYGPSNGRDLIGLAGDAAMRPLNYFPPYGAIRYGFSFNEYTDEADEFRRFTRTTPDSYAFVKQSWTYVRRNKVDEFTVTGNGEGLPLETLQAIFFDVQDPAFPNRSRTRSARIPATGKNLKFTYWLQPEPAPVVYIVPGLGAHRFDRSSVALAELVYGKGYSPVTVSSVFHPEFLDGASTTALPAYPPVDTHDLHVALSAIDRQLERMHPGHLRARGLLGFSMGGFHALTIAAGGSGTDPSLLAFDRIVAVNTPVSLLYGMDQLDEYYRAPLAWPADERTANIDLAFRKVAALIQQPLAADGGLPFDVVESKFLIGYAYRTTLRDIIFTSQLHENQGVLSEPVRKLRRSATYREILGYSYSDYLDSFVVPYYEARNVDLASPNALDRATNLRGYATGLRANPNVHLVMTRNDFLLGPGDLAWLHSVVPAQRVKVFERGGHMGNLKERDVQEAILSRFSNMLPLPRGLD